MAQDLTVNIKTTSDVPQAMDKAKAATNGFNKQVEDIGKKFSTSFKDIFLGFAAPMVLLQGAISMIQAAIAKAKQDAKDGLDLLAKGETVYASSEEKKMAAFFKAKKEREAEEKMAKEGRRAIAAEFIKSKEGVEIAKKIGEERGAPITDELDLLMMPRDPEFQKRALKAFLESEEGKKYKPIFEDKSAAAAKTADFKGPEGFGNVIGVGPNPVMEAMNAQLEEAKKQTAALERIASATPGALAPDFTKTATA
jgi:hypothetical protein